MQIESLKALRLSADLQKTACRANGTVGIMAFTNMK